MRKFLIGIIAACLLAVSAGTADAAVLHKRAVTKIVNTVGQACDHVANVLWRNKGAVAVGTTAVAVATHPEPFVQGAAAVVTGTGEALIKSGTGSSLLSYLLLPVLLIAAVWYFLRRIKSRWGRVLPLLLFGVFILFCFSGVVHAGVIAPVPEIQCGVVKPPFWWGDIIGWVLLIIAVFL